MLYNVYDKENNLVFVGDFKQVKAWLHCNARTLRKEIDICGAIKCKYYVISREDMRDYEVYRGNKAGYQRL